MGVDKMAAEDARVAELVVVRSDWQCHREVVALSKAKKDVLHSSAGCLVRLEENHVGVFDCGASLKRAKKWAAQSKHIYGPVETGNEL